MVLGTDSKRDRFSIRNEPEGKHHIPVHFGSIQATIELKMTIIFISHGCRRGKPEIIICPKTVPHFVVVVVVQEQMKHFD